MSEQSLMRDLISDLLLLEQIEFKAVFVPQSASRNSTDKNPCLNWRVSFTRTLDRGEGAIPHHRSMATDYMQGIGHVPGYLHPYGRLTIHEEEKLKGFTAAAETGLYPVRFGVKPLPAPHAGDVLHSFISDRSVSDARSFEDFANEYGYDTDSRKAEAIYRSCLKQTSEAEYVFGRDVLDKIAAILENY
jgi:hypothetical protein